ncbi:MAG: hypothetical protein AB8I08_27950 [Sandaracinaceae bacterium]
MWWQARRSSCLGAWALVCGLALVVGCTPARVGAGGMDGGTGRRDGDTFRDGSAGMDGGDGSDADPFDDGGGVDSGVDGGVTDGGGDSGVPGPQETDCTDGVDDDGDGAMDCADPDCDRELCDATRLCFDGTCGGCTGAATETSCGDGRDEDCDMLVDCADPDCEGQVCGPGDVQCGGGVCPCESGFEERLCGDGTDDDCDGVSDCLDPDCIGRGCGGVGEVCVGGGMCMCPGSGGLDLCDGVDANCDGVIDEGCPNGLDLGAATGLGVVGEGIGGAAFSDPCPTGSALVGVSGRADLRLDQLTPICAVLIFEVDDTTFPEDTFSVRRGAQIPGGAHGGPGGDPFEDVCPNNEVVIGMSGSAELQLGSIRLQCGSLTVERGGGFGWQVTVTPTGTLPLRGVSTGDSYARNCMPGYVMTGVAGRAGTRVTQLSLTCQRISVSLR